MSSQARSLEGLPQDQFDPEARFARPGSPISPLRSQVSSLMSDSPIRRTGSGVSPFTSPQGLGSLAPAVLPGLWRRASLQSQVTLQQQMSSLGQAYLPDDNLAAMAQLLPYGSALNLPGQVEEARTPSGKRLICTAAGTLLKACFCTGMCAESVAYLPDVTAIVDPQDTIKAVRSPQRPRSSSRRPASSVRSRVSSKADVQQAVSPIAKADRRGSAAAAEVSSSSESEGANAKNDAPAVSQAEHAMKGKGLWRQILLVRLFGCCSSLEQPSIPPQCSSSPDGPSLFPVMPITQLLSKFTLVLEGDSRVLHHPLWTGSLHCVAY